MENSGLNIQVHDNVFSCPDDILNKLEREIQYLPAEQSCVCINGKVYPVPRQISAFGDPGLSYSFSGLTVACQPWTPLLKEIKSSVEQLSGCSYNFVLINRYKDGGDCIGQHKDNEDDLVKDYPISSVSLGETRKMVFKRPNFTDHCLELNNNSMILMKAPTNNLWTHGIPRQRERKGVRVNLTFRKMAVNKRKNQEILPEVNKREKKDIQKDGIIIEGEFTENVFPVGENLFVVVCGIQEKVIAHVRRYKKYGAKYYPTKEGVTLYPFWFDNIFSRLPPKTQFDIDTILCCSNSEIQVSSKDFQNFYLTRSYSVKPDISICITTEEWIAIANERENVTTKIVDYIFKDVDFYKLYQDVVGEFVDECLPHTSDVHLGIQKIAEILLNVVSDLSKTCGTVSTPYIYDNNTVATTNEKSDFNSMAMSMEITEIVRLFYDRLWGYDSELTLLPVKYLNVDFLKHVCLSDVMSHARTSLCPPCDDP